MKNITALCVFCFLLINSTSFAQSTAKIDLPNFNEIELDISADVNIKQGDQQSVEVRGPQELIDLLNKELKGDTWEIKYNKRNVRSSKSLVIDITVPHLSEIDLNGSGDIKGVNAWHEEDMELGINGSGSIEMEVYVTDLELGINGSGDLKLTGSAEKLEVGINGSGDVLCEDLKCEIAEFSVNGSGDSKITVNKKLEATINGSGDISYNGDPSLKVRKNGSGSVKSISK